MCGIKPCCAALSYVCWQIYMPQVRYYVLATPDVNQNGGQIKVKCSFTHILSVMLHKLDSMELAGI